MSPDGERDGGRFSRYDLGERIRTFGCGETEGTGKILLHELPYLLRGIPTSLLLGGDFNCVLSGMDATGHPNHSRALQELKRGFDLMDMREAPQGRDIYTDYTSRGASRIDRIYAFRDLRGNKRGAETTAAAFTGHLAVVLQMAFNVTTMLRGRGFWRMNMALLRGKVFLRQLTQRWAEWKKLTKHYPHMVLWWERVAKVRLKGLFIREGTERRREVTKMENVYYACLYEALQHPLQHTERKAAINRLQAKIVLLHTETMARGEIELRTKDVVQEEMMSLYQLIKRRKRRVQRAIPASQAQENGTHTRASDIVRIFSDYMRNKYSPIPVNDVCIRTTVF
jgi:hypothetical protein